MQVNTKRNVTRDKSLNGLETDGMVKIFILCHGIGADAALECPAEL